ncbi:MAG: hypothetical protein K0S08_652 [Gammaproteobacteria bacterium]|jgi:hypothetical protein|nr:hypothetical protein [Gammaproteobacteria bacterium]
MLKNYFHSFFNKVNPESIHIEVGGEHVSFFEFSKRMFKERPLEFLLPASTVLILVVSCVGLSLVRHDTAHVLSKQNLQENTAKATLKQINDIRDQLEALQTSPQSSDAFKENLVKINSGLGDVQQSILTMKDDMDSQMSELKKEVNSNPNMKQYLDAKELPFKVISIDVIDQQPFASVNYDNHILPLAVQDALAGWVLDKADFATATAEFKNDKDQYVKVIIQGA